MAGSESESALTPFQLEVARVFFELSASRGFVLAGGAALAVQRLTTRPTQDLDLVTSPGHGDISAARDAFEAAVRKHGWTVGRVRDSATFCRLLVTGPEVLIVDLGVDSEPVLDTDSQHRRPHVCAGGTGRAQAGRLVRSSLSARLR